MRLHISLGSATAFLTIVGVAWTLHTVATAQQVPTFENRLQIVEQQLKANTTHLQQHDGDVALLSLTQAPIGSIVPYGGEQIPNNGNWKLCNGDPLSKDEYGLLFAVIRTSWGGNGDPNFNLPDLRGRFLRGVDPISTRDPDAALRGLSATGGATGAKVGTIQEGATRAPVTNFRTEPIAPHQHNLALNIRAFNLKDFPSRIVMAMFPTNDLGGSAAEAPDNSHKTDFGGAAPNGLSIMGGDRETRPANAAVNWIIRVR